MRSRRKLGLAGRAGRWSAQHCKAAIFGWIAFVVAAIVIGGALGTKTLTESQSGVGESGAASKTLAKAFPQGADESVLVQSRSGASASTAPAEEALGEVEAPPRPP